MQNSSRENYRIYWLVAGLWAGALIFGLLDPVNVGAEKRNDTKIAGRDCFPAGVMVDTSRGRETIEKIEIGERVLAITKQGKVVPVAVESTTETKAVVLEIRTNVGIVRATKDHLLRQPDGNFLAAVEVKVGNKLATWNGSLGEAVVTGIDETAGPVPVYGLTVSSPFTFVVDSFVVRN